MSFQDDLDYSHEGDAEPFFEQFYRQQFPNFHGMHAVKKDGRGQRNGIDRIIILDNGQQLTVDEKKRRRIYSDIALEVEHRYPNGRVKPGWIVDDLQINYLVYAMFPLGGPNRAYLFDFLGLRKAWQEHGSYWMQRYSFKGTAPEKNDGLYRTWNCFVPIGVVQAAVNDRSSKISIPCPVVNSQQRMLFETRCGRQCPDCEGIDTAEVLPGLWTCFDCGDEFEPRKI